MAERTVFQSISQRHVVSLAPWSMELAFMERHPELFSPVSGDGGTWGVFEVATKPSSPGRK